MKLLLAEDERSLSRALCAILQKNNYLVDAVYDGREALDYLENDVYDGAILDIMMPKMDGITVLKTIRAAGNATPVIILTAKGEVDDKVLGLDSGANDYLTKPFEAKELLARLRAMLRTQTPQTTSRMTFQNVTLDSATNDLVAPGGSVKLTGKEFQIMELLIRDPGVIISGEKLVERVWGYETDTDVNTVWVYLSNLRKKLSSIGADVSIKATRGVGYSLEAAK